MPPITTENQARQTTDTLLEKAGWRVVDTDKANIHATPGVTIRELPLNNSPYPRAWGKGRGVAIRELPLNNSPYPRTWGEGRGVAIRELPLNNSPSPRVLGEGRGEGRRFTAEQIKWLEMIRHHIAANLSIEPNDFNKFDRIKFGRPSVRRAAASAREGASQYALFSQQGGLGKVHQLFGDKLNTIIEELNETLAA